MRRIAIGFGILAVVLAGVAGVLFVYRNAILEPLAAQQLSALLGAPAELSIDEVSFGKVRATDLRMGDSDELRIGAATVHFRLRPPLGIELELVALDRVTLQVDMTGEGPMLGSLQTALESGDGGGAGDFRIPAIELSEGRINITFAGSAAAIAFDGHADTNEAGATEGEIRISAATIMEAGERIAGLRGTADFALGPHRALLANATLSLVESSPRLAPISAGDVTLALSREGLKLEASLREADEAAKLAFGSTITNYRGEPNAKFRLTARAASRSDIWARINLPVPASGAAELLLEGNARLPAFAKVRTIVSESKSPVDDLLTSTEMAGRLDVVLLDLVNDHIGKFDGSVGGRLALDNGNLSLRLPEGDLFSISNFADNVAARLPATIDDIQLSVPEGRALWATISSSPPGYTVTGEGSLLVAGPGEAALRIESRVTTRTDERFRPGPIAIEEYFVRLAGADFWPGFDLNGATIQLAGEAARSEDGDVTGAAMLEANADGINGGGATSGPTSIQAALDFAWDGSSARIRLRERGEIVAESAGYGDTLAIPGRFRAQLNRLDMTLMQADGNGTPRFAVAAEIEPADFVATLGPPSGETARVEVAAGPLSVETVVAAEGRISSAIGLRDARVAALGHGATLNGLSARVTIDPRGSSATTSFEIASLEHASEPPMVAPISVDGNINIVSGRVEGSARVFHRGDLQIASVALSSSDDATRLSVEAEDISFSPSGLQPRDLFPGADFLSSAAGSVRGRATVTVTNGEVSSQGTLELASLSFSSSKGSVRSLRGAIVFDSLWPPSTPAGQRLTAERASFVLPTDRVEAVFQLLPGDPVRILLETARAGFVGGTLATSDALIDPSAAAQDLVIKLEDIDLEKLLGLLALEGLSGTGTISGDVPVSVLDTGAVIIRNSELRALGPGVIQLKSDTVANALKSGGESVDLMLRALEDFHYKSLVLSADKAEDGEATILLSLSGQNPAVLEGQPFDFNIRLGTNLDTISEAVRQGLGISGNFFGNLR